MSRKYSSFVYGHYAHGHETDHHAVIPLAPADWEAKTTKTYVVNLAYLSPSMKTQLNDPRLEDTIYRLNTLMITGQVNTTVRFVRINNSLFLDPFFTGISENMFFNSYCCLPDLGLSPRSRSTFALKINMLGGHIVSPPHHAIDILLCPRQPTRKMLLKLLNTLEIDQCKNLVSLTTLNQIFRQYFPGTSPLCE